MGKGNWREKKWACPLFAVPNVTAHPSTVSVPITVLLYPLLCGFNVPIKGLTNFYNDDDDGDVVVDDDDDDEGDDDDVYFIQHPLRRHRQLHDDGVRLRRSCPCSNA